MPDVSTEKLPSDLTDALQQGRVSEMEHLIEKEMDALVDITDESECLKEIKDVLDELNSISHVFERQIGVVKSIMNSQRHQKPTAKETLPRTEVDQKIKFMKRWEKE